MRIRWSFRAKFLVVLGGIYVAQIVFDRWMKVDYLSVLALSPNWQTFKWWQVFTFSLVEYPHFTFHYVWAMWIIYQCVDPVVATLGRLSFFILFFGASLFSISTWWLCSSLLAFMHVQAFGFSASTFAILLVFCRTHNTATLNIMWLLPIQATHFLYFIIFASVVAFLAGENPSFGLHIGGLIFAVIYTARGERLFLGIAHWLATAPLKIRLYWRRRRRGISLVKTNPHSNSDSIK